VIPLFYGGVLWRVNIRRPLTAQQEADGETKYVQIAGSKMALYSADALNATPAVLVEGEIDALTITQHAGDLATAVATGSTQSCRRLQWISKLALSPKVLVAFDADKAGEEAAEYWLGVLSNAKRWRPYWSDPNAMAQNKADIRAWVEAGLATSEQTQDRHGKPEVGEVNRVGVGSIEVEAEAPTPQASPSERQQTQKEEKPYVFWLADVDPKFPVPLQEVAKRLDRVYDWMKTIPGERRIHERFRNYALNKLLECYTHDDYFHKQLAEHPEGLEWREWNVLFGRVQDILELAIWEVEHGPDS
jgi:5S rRNA maturation endonuclease (ribonuclease M5)